MADLITDLVEGLGSYTIFYYKDATKINENTVISNKFDKIDISAIVLNEKALDGKNPNDVVQLVYENQLNGWGIFTNSKDSVIMLIVNKDNGKTEFHYYSENPSITKELKEIGNPGDQNTGDFILENLKNFEKATNEEMVEEEPTTTHTTTPSIQETIPSTITSTAEPLPIEENHSGFDFTFSILPLIILITMIVLIFRKIKGKNSSNVKREKEPEFNKIFDTEEGLKGENKELQDNIDFQKELYSLNEENCFLQLRKLQQDFIRLWNLVKDKDNESELQTLSIKYTDSLDRLNRVVSEEYWGRIVKTPQDWSNPSERLNNIKEAIEIIEKDIINNIKRVNDDLSLDFDLDLKIIKNQGKNSQFKDFK